MSKVITANAVTDITVPVPEVDAVAPSFEFGSGDDFGNGWGGGAGGGGGSGGGFASFYNTKMKADRVAYVIDYSASMGGQRDHLMRAELARSVGALKGKIEYQLIFFAGPAWVAGDEVNGGKQTAVINSSGGKEYEWFSNGGPHAFQPKSKGDIQKPKWLMAGKSQINQSMDHIQETPLVWGTTWEPAIDMALRMSPKPNVIFLDLRQLRMTEW